MEPTTLKIPDSEITLHEGDVVIIEKYPDVNQVVHHGFYTYEDEDCFGWYFSSIPENTILPVTPEDLEQITIVAQSNNCMPPRPCPPGPCPPITPPWSETIVKDVNAAFITVKNLEARDRLYTKRFPNGKIVCVADVDGDRKYYVWDKSAETWIEVLIEIDPNMFTTPEQVQYAVDAGVDEALDAVEQMVNPRFGELTEDLLALETRVELHENNTYTKSEIDTFLDWGPPLV